MWVGHQWECVYMKQISHSVTFIISRTICEQEPSHPGLPPSEEYPLGHCNAVLLYHRDGDQYGMNHVVTFFGFKFIHVHIFKHHTSLVLQFSTPNIVLMNLVVFLFFLILSD